MHNHRGTFAAALGGLVMLATVGSALAAPAVATTNVNVRSGPGSYYDAVDVLQRGDRVDVQGCQDGWCYVENWDLEGWVSWQYLAERNRPSRPSVTFQFNFGDTPRFDPPRHHNGNGGGHHNGNGNWNNGNWNNGNGNNGNGNNGNNGNGNNGGNHNGNGNAEPCLKGLVVFCPTNRN